MAMPFLLQILSMSSPLSYMRLSEQRRILVVGAPDTDGILEVRILVTVNMEVDH